MSYVYYTCVQNFPKMCFCHMYLDVSGLFCSLSGFWWLLLLCLSASYYCQQWHPATCAQVCHQKWLLSSFKDSIFSNNVIATSVAGKSLLWVAALAVVIFYIYAVVSFAFLHESFEAPDNDDATLFCSTLYECFVSTIRYGLIENLGLVCYLYPL